MSKKYLAIDKRNNEIIKKYSQAEFAWQMSLILHDFVLSRGMSFFWFSDEHKATHVDEFIEYWNKHFYTFGKQTRLQVWRDSDDGYKKHTDVFNKLEFNYIVFAKILKAAPDWYDVSYLNPQWVLFNFNDVTFLGKNNVVKGSSYYTTHYHWSKTRSWGVRNKHHFEKYYAKLNDSKYYKNNGEPLPRRMHGTLGSRNTWDDWEDECVSTKGNWKHSTKDKHQWEHRLKLKEPKNIEVIKGDPYTLAAYDWDILNNISYDQPPLDVLDYPWLYKDFNVIPGSCEIDTLYNKEHNKDETE